MPQGVQWGKPCKKYNGDPGDLTPSSMLPILKEHKGGERGEGEGPRQGETCYAAFTRFELLHVPSGWSNRSGLNGHKTGCFNRLDESNMSNLFNRLNQLKTFIQLSGRPLN